MLANAAAIAHRSQLFQDDRLLGSLPLFHMGGTVFTVLASITSGACVLLTRWADAVPCIAEQRVTVVPGVQTMVSDLSKDPGLLRSVRVILMQGSVEFCTRIRELTDRAVCNTYGLTECSPNVTMTDLYEGPYADMGRPQPGVQIKVVDSEGNALPPGTPGTIWVRGWNVMGGYLGVPSEQQPFAPGGWLVTADRGRIDEAGRLTFIGRASDSYKSGGELVSILEVENAIQLIPGIRQVAVLARPHERFGQVGAAFVELDAGSILTADQITIECKRVLAHFKVPKTVHIYEELPRTGSGKIDRQRLFAALARMGVPDAMTGVNA
jgi:fatty-acyl-CoA synthase